MVFSRTAKKRIILLAIPLGIVVALLLAYQIFMGFGSGFTWQEAISKCYLRGGYFGRYDYSANNTPGVLGSVGPACKAIISGQPIDLYE